MRRWLERALAIATLVLSGCSALPVITPDMARVDPSSVHVQAANGRIVSPERSRELLANLASGSDAVAHHLALEQAVAGAPPVLGNKVVLLENGPNTYAAMFDAIASARDSIDMETYILDDDEVGRRLADALIARRAQGVQVNLIHDGVGTLGTPKAYFQRLSDAGIQIVEFNPVNPLTAKAGWDVNQRDHRKLLVIDGKSAVLGGINISSVYSSSPHGSGAGAGSNVGSRGGDKTAALPWRDTDLLIEGPVVADLQKLFVETWNGQKGAPLPQARYFPSLQAQGTEVVRAIGSTPDEPYSQIYVTLISAINSAESEILLTNAYFVPDPQLMQALIGAAARGVDVKLIVPSTTDSSLVFHAGRAHYETLLEGGVKLYERRAALLHAKTAVIDGVWATVGSTNLDWRSFLHNQEVNAVILGAEFGAKMRAAFARDLAASDQITIETWHKRPLSAHVKEMFARLWEYWL